MLTKLQHLQIARHHLLSAKEAISEALGETDVGMDYMAELGHMLEDLDADIEDVKNPAIDVKEQI